MSAAALAPMQAPSRFIAPLLVIWQRILQTSAITPDSNFFDLGGDSLMAVNMFLEIERETGRSLPITTIYDAATISELAALLDGSAAPEFSPLVLLKEGDNNAPLFIAHGVGGTVIEFAALGKFIDIPSAVYAIQAQGLDGSRPPLETVEEMAELYCSAIRQKQPTGPYWLCGYSFGGLVAVEMARRLKSDGQDIALLFLIDAYAHPVTWPLKSRLKMCGRKAVMRVLAAVRQTLHGDKTLLLSWGTSIVANIKSRVAPIRQKKTHTAAPQKKQLRQWLLHRNPNLPLPLLQTRIAGEAAVSRYTPAFYPGSIVFLKAKKPDPDFPDDPKHVWRRLAKRFKLYAAPGSHLTIITEHADSVGARITSCIEEVRNERASRNLRSGRGASTNISPVYGEAR